MVPGRGVNFHLPQGGQFSAAVDTAAALRSHPTSVPWPIVHVCLFLPAHILSSLLLCDVDPAGARRWSATPGASLRQWRLTIPLAQPASALIAASGGQRVQTTEAR